MKTQLLQDFQESGSAPGAPRPIDPPPADVAAAPPPADVAAAPASADVPAAPVARPRPAVWHGPGAQRGAAGAAVQRADPGAMQRAPDTPARGLGVAIEAWAERAAQRPPAAPPIAPAAVQPETADEATLPGYHARPRPAPPPPDPPPGPPEPRPDPATIPRPDRLDAEAEWLAARMRAEASLRETPAWSSMWKRRLVTWSITGGLLAGLVAGGLWLYEENRVDDALVVVANTTPAGPEPPVAASGAQAFAAGAPDVVKPVPAPAEPEVGNAPLALPPVAGTPAAVMPPPAAASPETVDVNPPRRTPRHAASARKRAAAKARHAQDQVQERAPVAATPSPRQRREETLMQCRAHGYDERQCFQRACTMTRYGLACKG